MERIISLFRLVDRVQIRKSPLDILRMLCHYEKETIKLETISQRGCNNQMVLYLANVTMLNRSFFARDRCMQKATDKVALLVYDFLKSLANLDRENEKNLDILLEKWVSLILQTEDSYVDESALEQLACSNSVLNFNDYSQDWESTQSSDDELNSLLTDLKGRGFTIKCECHSTVDTTSFEPIYHASINIPKFCTFFGQSDKSNIDAIKEVCKELKLFYLEKMILGMLPNKTLEVINQINENENDNDLGDFLESLNGNTELISTKESINSTLEISDYSSSSNGEFDVQDKQVDQIITNTNISKRCFEKIHIQPQQSMFLDAILFDKFAKIIEQINSDNSAKSPLEVINDLSRIEPFKLKSKFNAKINKYISTVVYFNITVSCDSTGEPDSRNKALEMLFYRLKELGNLISSFKSIYSFSKPPIEIIKQLKLDHGKLVKLLESGEKITVRLVHLGLFHNQPSLKDSRISAYTKAVDFLKDLSEKININNLPNVSTKLICNQNKAKQAKKIVIHETRTIEPKFKKNVKKLASTALLCDPSKLPKQDFDRISIVNLFNSVFSPNKSPSEVIKDMNMNRDILKFSFKYVESKNVYLSSVEIVNFALFSGESAELDESKEIVSTDAFNCLYSISQLIYLFKKENISTKSPSEIMNVLLERHKKIIKIKLDHLHGSVYCTKVTFVNMSSVSASNKFSAEDSKNAAFKLAVELLGKWSQLIILSSQIQLPTQILVDGIKSNHPDCTTVNKELALIKKDKINQNETSLNQEQQSFSHKGSSLSPVSSNYFESSTTYQPIDKLIRLINDFDSVYDPDKSSQDILDEINDLNGRLITVHIDVLKNPSWYVTKVIVKDIFELRADADTKHDSYSEALFKLIDLLKNFTELVCDFKSTFSESKCPLEIIKNLTDNFHSIIMKTTVSVFNQESLYTTTIQFVNLCSFTKTEPQEIDSKRAVAFEAIDYLRKLSDGF